MKLIKGVLVKPGCEPETVVFEYRSYKDLQRMIGGTFEMPAFLNDADMVINDEGKLLGLQINKYVCYKKNIVDYICGNILIVDADSEGKLISLSETKIVKYMDLMKKPFIEIDY